MSGLYGMRSVPQQGLNLPNYSKLAASLPLVTSYKLSGQTLAVMTRSEYDAFIDNNEIGVYATRKITRWVHTRVKGKNDIKTQNTSAGRFATAKNTFIKYSRDINPRFYDIFPTEYRPHAPSPAPMNNIADFV